MVHCEGHICHVRVAVDNYKKVEENDKDGNVITREVADGTVTYYDFYARDGAGSGTHDEDRVRQINKFTSVRREELGRVDLGTGQGRPANDVIRMTAGVTKTRNVGQQKERLYQAQQQGNPTAYNGEKFYCAIFAKATLDRI